ncbi:Ankyrin repeat-containing protein [Glarea lozoyensis ATCC 20868]|uniref:Ankyrin repeat-containing protein n=1 Tax=Glarea lozoyensis (strain ATCC 20868 / MF5171) TaxID=1116229 RepID=S3D0P2_GLAL2|nr:Ankyrin repeat-containing protein [Glarea lozoyensis ATCC 20868]EPE30724.1 Ankyrin repeat-containing protein [Glarea lozoyensis ATCC 20868]
MVTDGGELTRTRSRSTDHTERLEPQLLRAAENDNVEKLRDLLASARLKGQLQEHHLRIALMRSSEKGKVAATKYLLSEGAPPDGAPGNRLSPLLRAVDRNHIAIVAALLEHGANPETSDKKGRNALMTAAWKNHYHILNSLIKHGADVNAKDLRGRNVLHNLAADKCNNWGDDVIEVLLRQNIYIDDEEGQDELQRTPLHWACVTGKKRLVEQLLTRPKGPRAKIDAVEVREKTGLHLASAHDRDNIVEFLISNGANVHARSDGGWTPLHNACAIGSEKIVRLVVEAGADVNGKLLNGMTPLHLAAEGGHLSVVNYLLTFKHLKRAARDTFGSTPFLRAAQNKRKDIVSLLAPFNNLDSLSSDALGACNGFNATIVDFGDFRNENKVQRRTVFELLYGRDSVNPRKPAMTIRPDNKAASFRWIHLPANNMAWVEALLTKLFIEEGASDIEGFKALERSFSHQHRGQQSHSHFMRPLCQSTPRAVKVVEADAKDENPRPLPPPPTIVVNGAADARSVTTPRTPTRGSTSASGDDWLKDTPGSGKEHGKGSQKEKSKKGHDKAQTKGSKSPKIGSDNATPKNSKEQRKATYLHQSKAPRSPSASGRRDAPLMLKENVYTFMPYLHFETNQKCQEMQRAVKQAEMMRSSAPRNLSRAKTFDEMLIRAHLTSSTVSLHIRRTLDQSFYHNIDTKWRDLDQVVYRYQLKDTEPNEPCDPKIVMVDQLWMWVLGKDLVVTSFPQRWQQPKNDPLNVLDSIIEDINDKTRDPVKSVYDLAMIVTSRCTGVFDRHRMGDEDYQFLDMFESSIGNATDKETLLFKEFNEASAQASAWLQHNRRLNRPSRIMQPASYAYSKTHDPAKSSSEPDIHNFEDFIRGPMFVDKLLDIGQETDLLAETKDIRDELNMIKKVLEDQQSVIPTIEAAILDIYQEEKRNQQEVKKRFAEQMKTVLTHIKDIDRMDKQAERIYASVTDMLDLKQKHANAFEARFARDQATSTARQSQTVMVFTIVTIVFLPMSFIAAFFAINIREFQQRDGGLGLGYVSKYMFGIGLSISIPMIFVAFYLDDIGEFLRRLRNWNSERKRLKRQRHYSGNGEVDGLNLGIGISGLEAMRMEQVLSVRKSADTEWVRERLSMGQRPATARSSIIRPVMKREITGFRMRESGDIERGNL